jgi:hypothetical protein
MGKLIKLRRFFRIVGLVYLFFGYVNVGYSINDYSPSELPDAIIAYSFYCSHYLNEFKGIKLNANTTFMKLQKNLDGLKCDISTNLAFTHRSFIVQDETGYYAGYKRIDDMTIEESKIPYENILFITTPIEELRNRILVILSSIRPERVTIISVDSEMNTNLIYDSFNKSDDIGISSLYGIKVISVNSFLLEGRISPKYLSFYQPLKNRSYVLKIIGPNNINVEEIRKGP